MIVYGSQYFIWSFLHGINFRTIVIQESFENTFQGIVVTYR